MTTSTNIRTNQRMRKMTISYILLLTIGSIVASTAAATAPPIIDARVASGRADGAFLSDGTDTYLTSQLAANSLPSDQLYGFTVHFFIRSIIPSHFAQIMLYEIPPSLVVNDAPLSIYTYTDWTVVLNGQLVSESLYTYLALDGAWHSSTVTWNSTTGIMEFFLDGVSTSVHSDVQTGQGLASSGVKISIGKDRWNDDLLGFIDDFSMYPNILSPTDIQFLAGIGLTPDAPLQSLLPTFFIRTKPAFYYTFDVHTISGAVGDVLPDISGNGNDLIASGSISSVVKRMIVPSGNPLLSSNEKWLVVPTNELCILELADSSDTTSVTITNLALAGVATLYQVTALGAQGAVISSTPTTITAVNSVFQIMVLITGTISAQTTYFEYSATPTTGSTYLSHIVLTPNTAPTIWPRTVITVDQNIQVIISTVFRIYPGDHNYMPTDSDGDDTRVWLTSITTPTSGVYSQVDVDGVTVLDPIDPTNISLSNPLLLTSPQGYLAYQAPLDAYGTEIDSFNFIVSDQFTTSNTSTKLITVTRLPHAPIVTPPTTPIQIEEGHGMVITLPIDTSQLTNGDFPYITITNLPQKGKLYQVTPTGERGDEITLEPAFGGTLGQWVSQATNWSSYYDDSHGYWGVNQLLGPPNAFPIYGDSVYAWASATTDSAEWLELAFNETVFISRVEVFENYNPKHLQRVLAKNSDNQWQLLWSGQPDPPVQSASGTRAYVNLPPLCPVSFASREIRLEIASTGPSWAEIDAVRLTGTHSLAKNVVTDPSGRVWYEADPLSKGADSFDIFALGCDYFILYRELGVNTHTMKLDIQYHNHPPVPTSDVWFTDQNGVISQLILGGTDPDQNQTLTISLEALPKYGTITYNGHAVTPDQLPLRAPFGSSFTYSATSYCLYHDQAFLYDSFGYRLSDQVIASSLVTPTINIFCAKPYVTSSGLFGAIVFVCALGCVAVIVIGIIMIHYRHTSIMKASTLVFNLLAQLGCIGLFLSILPFILPVNNSLCIARWWLPCTSLTLLLAAVFSKTRRIQLIFTAQKLSVVRVKDHHVAAWIGGLLGVTVVLLILYTSISTPKLYYSAATPFAVSHTLPTTYSQDDHLSYAGCSIDNAFRGVIFGYIGMLVLWGTWLAISVRNAPSSYNESTYLGMSIYNVLFCSVIGLPLDLAIEGSPVSQMVLRCFIIFLGTSVCVGVLFGSKLALLYGAFTRVNPYQETHQDPTHTGGQTAGGTGAVLSKGGEPHGQTPNSSHYNAPGGTPLRSNVGGRELASTVSFVPHTPIAPPNSLAHIPKPQARRSMQVGAKRASSNGGIISIPSRIPRADSVSPAQSPPQGNSPRQQQSGVAIASSIPTAMGTHPHRGSSDSYHHHTASESDLIAPHTLVYNIQVTSPDMPGSRHDHQEGQEGIVTSAQPQPQPESHHGSPRSNSTSNLPGQIETLPPTSSNSPTIEQA